jgi:hydroxylamine reductase
MFCYQCEQVMNGKGCTQIGVCGKKSDVAALQDLLIYLLQGLSKLAILAREQQIYDHDVDVFICEGLFATVTNVDFDPERIADLLKRADELSTRMKKQLQKSGVNESRLQEGVMCFELSNDLKGMIRQGQEHGLLHPKKSSDVESLKHTALFGIKGMSAYADHAQILGKEDSAIYYFMQKILADLDNDNLSSENWFDRVMDCGKVNLQTMALLDEAHTSHYGHPVPTQVPLGPKKGKAILVSGHDLKDLELLLEQTKGKDIYIYTHGEMLPAHGYPALKTYKHFYGHYGTAWQNQHEEFEAFPGAILMTTNCIQQPLSSYAANIFTTGLVAWPNISHIDEHKDFTPIIDRASTLSGFEADIDRGSVNVGFGHHAVLSIADKVIRAVKNGKIRHFFLVGGCDGAKPGRNYYTELVEQLPKDCVVLTLACGKFRFFDKQLGDVDGIPRLLDIGQCNDAYSAIQIALALAKAFDCDVNALPLSLILSWYEQKAVVILLTLLSLGIKNIRLGPTLPAFITPNILKVLSEKFNIQPITTPELDIKAIIADQS